MREVADNAIVVNRGSRVDNHMRADHGVRLHNGSRKNNGPRTEPGRWMDVGARMHHGLPASVGMAQSDSLASSIVANGDDRAEPIGAAVEPSVSVELSVAVGDVNAQYGRSPAFRIVIVD